MVSIMALSIYIPTNSDQDSPFPHNLGNSWDIYFWESFCFDLSLLLGPNPAVFRAQSWLCIQGRVQGIIEYRKSNVGGQYAKYSTYFSVYSSSPLIADIYLLINQLVTSRYLEKYLFRFILLNWFKCMCAIN